MNAKLCLRAPAIVALGASLAIFQPQASFARPPIYTEAVSGDLPGDQSFPLLVGALALGINFVTGHDSVDSDTAPGEGDTFGLTLSAGQRISSIVLEVTDNTNVADNFALTIFQSPFLQDDHQVLTAGGGGSFPFTPFGSQSPGQYNFSIQAETSNQPANGFDWEWDIEVASVPELSSWAMLLMGFAGVGALVYRRSRRSGEPAVV